MDSSDAPRKPRRTKSDETDQPEETAAKPKPKKTAEPKAASSESTTPAEKPRARKSTHAPAEPAPTRPPLPQAAKSTPPAAADDTPSFPAKPVSPFPARPTPLINENPAAPVSAPKPAAPAAPQSAFPPKPTPLINETPAVPMSTPKAAAPAPAPQSATPAKSVDSESKPAEKLPGHFVAVARTLALRNIEIGRKLGKQASTRINEGWKSVSARVSTTTQTGSEPLKDIRTRANTGLGKIAMQLDNGLTNLQHNLEKNDSAVIGLTLGLIVACVLLTILAVFWWNHS